MCLQLKLTKEEPAAVEVSTGGTGWVLSPPGQEILVEEAAEAARHLQHSGWLEECSVCELHRLP